MIQIHIAKDFSDALGARYKKDGDFSGEEFYEDILKVKFQEALDQGEKLFIDFDGTYGYPSSFLSEAFGSLFKEFGGDKIWDTLQCKSEEDTSLIDFIKVLLKDYEQ